MVEQTQTLVIVNLVHPTFRTNCLSFFVSLIYATADEADAYMFYRCFFVFFCFFLLFPSVKKYETTVLGNG